MKSFFTKAATRWRHPSGKLHVYVVAPPQVRELAAAYQAAMAPFEGHLVSLQPLDHLHFTVQMIEQHHPHDLNADQIHGLARELGDELTQVAPFDLTVDFVRVGVHGLTLPGGRSAAFMDLVHRTRATITRVLGAEAIAPLPRTWGLHMSLGYGLAAGDSDPLIQAIGDRWYDVKPVTFTVHEVQLLAVDQDRDRGHYTWKDGTTIPLGR